METKNVIVRTIYDQLLESWNTQNANDYANLFAEDARVVGFDGSEMNGKKDIQTQLEQIFSNHQVSSYVSIVRDVRQWSENIFMLIAHVGMFPPGSALINSKVNAVQTLVVSLEKQQAKIILFQNTPAAYHGRPEKVDQLTQELNAVSIDK